MELTKDQIEAAAKAAYKRSRELGHNDIRLSWENCHDLTRNDWREVAIAAVPFLQMPWDGPTNEEIHDTHLRIRDRFSGIDYYLVTASLSDFVRCRNAALLPKPVDPRREKVIAAVDAVKSYHRLGEEQLTSAEVADRILAALDAKD